MYKLRKYLKDKQIRFKKIKDKAVWRRVETEATTRNDIVMFKAMQTAIANADASGKHIVYADECLFSQKLV